MRSLWIIALCPVALAARGAGLELELGPGVGWSTDVSASSPMLRARAGIEMGWLTPSVAAMGALFQNAAELSDRPGGQNSALRGWGVAAELRFHTPGRHRLDCGLGVGWGQFIALQPRLAFGSGYRGHAAPYVNGTLGYRFLGHGPMILGVDLTLDVFNRLDHQGESCAASQCPTGSSFFVIGIAASIGWRFGAI